MLIVCCSPDSFCVCVCVCVCVIFLLLHLSEDFIPIMATEIFSRFYETCRSTMMKSAGSEICVALTGWFQVIVFHLSISKPGVCMI